MRGYASLLGTPDRSNIVTDRRALEVCDFLLEDGLELRTELNHGSHTAPAKETNAGYGSDKGRLSLDAAPNAEQHALYLG